MNTYPTHTAREMARPSRLRVLRARVIAWHDEHANGVFLAVVALVAVALASFAALALIGDGAPVASSWQSAIASLAIAAIVGILTYHIGQDVATTRENARRSFVAREISRDMGDEIARLTRERDDIAAALSATQADVRTAQDEARDLRATVARYASALVDMALNDDDEATA